MKTYLPIAVAVVLLASIVGTFRAFAIPNEIEQQFTALTYEHVGEFDYSAHVKAAYIFGDTPLEVEETSPEVSAGQPTNPKYPVEYIDWFSMTFNYAFVPDSDESVENISVEVEIEAVLNKKDEEDEEITLVPARTVVGNFNTDFQISSEELEESSSITINADVYTTAETTKGPIFESFTQSLTMQLKGPLVEVNKNLESTHRASFGDLSYEQVGTFDYTVRLKPESPFGAISLEAPSVTSSEPSPEPPVMLSSKTLGPEDSIFLRLFDRMDMTFSYNFESSRPVSQRSEEVEVNAILEDPGVWSKTFVLVPPTKREGDFNVSFPVSSENLSYFRDVFGAIQQETGVSVPNKLTIKADVHTVARTDLGQIDEKFSQTLSTTLGGNILEWEEELIKSEPGTIETIQMIPNPARFMGLSSREAKIVFPALNVIFLASFAFLVVLYMRSKPEKLLPVEEESQRAKKKYKGIIVDVRELPEGQGGEIISLSSLEELVKTADSLLKPVLHKAEPWQHTYCVIDGSIRYEYVLTADSFDNNE